MRRFRFPLEKVRRLRAQDEKLARRALAETLGVVHALQARIDAMEGSAALCEHETIGAAGSLARALVDGLAVGRQRLVGELAAAEQRTELAREAYARARQRLAGLDRLREKAHETWRVEQMRLEQAELDELARLRHARGDAVAEVMS